MKVFLISVFSTPRTLSAPSPVLSHTFLLCTVRRHCQDVVISSPRHLRIVATCDRGLVRWIYSANDADKMATKRQESQRTLRRFFGVRCGPLQPAAIVRNTGQNERKRMYAQRAANDGVAADDADET